MNEKLRKRITMFYLAGFINLLLGLYVLFQGRGFLEPNTMTMLLFFFFAFAVVDFYFVYALKKKWYEEQAKMSERSGQGSTG